MGLDLLKFAPGVAWPRPYIQQPICQHSKGEQQLELSSIHPVGELRTAVNADDRYVVPVALPQVRRGPNIHLLELEGTAGLDCPYDRASVVAQGTVGLGIDLNAFARQDGLPCVASTVTSARCR